MASEEPLDSLDFESITSKQREVLDHLVDGRTSKEIAALVGVSESAVTQRIEGMRHRSGWISRAALVRQYKDWLSKCPHSSCKQFTGQIFQVPSVGKLNEVSIQDDLAGSVRFADVGIAFQTDPPWQATEPRIVPEVLDGQGATLYRCLAAVGISVGIAVTILVMLAVANTLGEWF